MIGAGLRALWLILIAVSPANLLAIPAARATLAGVAAVRLPPSFAAKTCLGPLRPLIVDRIRKSLVHHPPGHHPAACGRSEPHKPPRKRNRAKANAERLIALDNISRSDARAQTR